MPPTGMLQAEADRARRELAARRRREAWGSREVMLLSAMNRIVSYRSKPRLERYGWNYHVSI